MHLRHITLKPVAVDADVSVEDAARAIEASGGRHLPVVQAGRVLGVVLGASIDDQGLLRQGTWVGWGRATTARDLLTVVPQVTLVGESRTPDEALDALLDHPCVLLVDDEGALLGLMTEHDGVRVALERLGPDDPALPAASAPVRTIGVDDPGGDGLQRMGWHHTRHLVLVDGDRPIGVVSERDLKAEGVHEGRSLSMGEVWRERPLVSAPATATLMEVATRIVDERVGCLPLLDEGGAPVGILTRRDLIRIALGGRRDRRVSAP
ncbi:MAG: CBS domain-containing protein [Myxococcota bacterium]